MSGIVTDNPDMSFRDPYPFGGRCMYTRGVDANKVPRKTDYAFANNARWF